MGQIKVSVFEIIGRVWMQRSPWSRESFSGSTEYRTMKSLFLLSFLIFLSSVARAEMSPREYEAQLVQKKRDFQNYLNERLKASEVEKNAALEMRISREKELRRQSELERQYREKMKRYSMEEVEARDRADEKRIESEQARNEELRLDFIARRDRLRELDKAISPVDELKEFDIDMSKEPDFKSSYPSAEMPRIDSGDIN